MCVCVRARECVCVCVRVFDSEITGNCHFKGKQDEADSKREAPETPSPVSIKAASSSDEPDTEEYVSADEGEPELIVDVSSRNSLQQEESSAQCSTCLTIQPNRILCGVRLQ